DGDVTARLAGAAHDDVIPPGGNASFHLAFLPQVRQVAFDPERGDGAEAIEDGAEAGHDEYEREGPARRRERMDLAVADRRDGRDRHVEGVEGAPAFDRHVPERARADDGEEQRHDVNEAGRDPHAISTPTPASSARRSSPRSTR